MEHAQGSAVPVGDRRHDAIMDHTIPAPVQIDELHARPAQGFPHQTQMGPGLDLADGEYRPQIGIEDRDPVPAPLLRDLPHARPDHLQWRWITPPAVDPANELGGQLGVAGAEQLHVGARIGQQVFDLLPLLLGDHRQGALGIQAHALAELPIGEAADGPEQQGDGKQEEDEQDDRTGVALRVGRLGMGIPGQRIFHRVCSA